MSAPSTIKYRGRLYRQATDPKDALLDQLNQVANQVNADARRLGNTFSKIGSVAGSIGGRTIEGADTLEAELKAAQPLLTGLPKKIKKLKELAGQLGV